LDYKQIDNNYQKIIIYKLLLLFDDEISLDELAGLQNEWIDELLIICE